MKKKILILPLLAIMLTGCAELMKMLETSVPTSAAPLTETEVANGLKEALITGAKNSSSILGATDGYYGDALVKILLPEEANVIIENISKIPGGQKLVDDVVLRVNRAAEDAAKEAAPIFINSIKQMTITDAFSILRGNDDAATQYLVRTTRTNLYNLYKPKIQTSTKKELIAGMSTKESWEKLTGAWNKFANSVAGRVGGFKPVNVDLDDYLTNKGLDGLFLKVKDEEKKIRTQASARITPLLEKVFGSLDK
ncbi:MAG: DUF4197 domain-containing protein [Bacteroidales bacterium]|nr:DUF4197 domain-containing protein [Bacteroidales bacterium]